MQGKARHAICHAVCHAMCRAVCDRHRGVWNDVVYAIRPDACGAKCSAVGILVGLCDLRRDDHVVTLSDLLGS